MSANDRRLPPSSAKCLSAIENKEYQRGHFVRLHSFASFFVYVFDTSNNKSLLIGIYFDAELISEVDVNLGTP